MWRQINGKSSAKKLGTQSGITVKIMTHDQDKIVEVKIKETMDIGSFPRDTIIKKSGFHVLSVLK